MQRIFVKNTCGLRLISTSSTIMEGYIETVNGKKRPAASPLKTAATPEKVPFVGISPLKEFNFTIPRERTFKVSVEGNIGAGKSTLIRYFEGLPGIETYAEPLHWWRNLDGHNLLDLLYTDINRWLSTFQSYVQLSRLKIQTSKPQYPNTTVQMFERSIQNNRFCFVEQAHQAGYLHGADYAILDQWYRWIRANVDIGLDLIVYLRSTPEVVYERMKARGRPEESSVTLEYLQQLHDSHEKWLMTNDEKFNTVPVLVLNADTTLDEIINQYKKHELVILGKEDSQEIMKRNSVKKVLSV